MGVHDWIPFSVELSSRFCYFLDLNSSDSYGSLRNAKRALYSEAKSAIVAPIQAGLAIQNQTADSDDHIGNAIRFLQEAAQSERNKEIRVINNYIDELKKNPLISTIINSKSKEGHDMNTLIQDLQDFSNNPTSDGIQDFYKKLILLINTIRSEIESFQTRLNNFVKEKTIGTKNYSQQEIRSTFAPFRLASDLDLLFKSATGTIQKEQDNSMSKKMRDLIIQFVLDSFKRNKLFLNNPLEFFAAVMIDFEIYLQKYYDKLPPSERTTLEDLNIEEIFKKYTEKETNLMQTLKLQNEEAHTLIQSIQEQTGLSSTVNKDSEKKYEENKRLLEKNLSTRADKPLLDNYKKVKKRFGNKITPEVTWSLKGSGVHGSIYELILPVINSAFSQKISGHAATDVLTLNLGTLEVNVTIQQQIQEQYKQIAKSLEDAAKIQRQDRLQDMTYVARNMNSSIINAQNEINRILKENNMPKDIFIYHQSLKLYTTVETHEVNQFHGREMNILNALDNLYSMNDINNLTLIEKDLMYNIALNLSSEAVGGVVKGEVENYLSIFAGLLMFDDLQNMAYDIARNINMDLTTQTQGELYQVHLYLLNGIYVPGSFLMTTVANAISQGYARISADYGAKVSINTSGADASIQEYLNARANGNLTYYTNDDENSSARSQGYPLWQQYGNKVMSGTKMEIIFLKSFLEFMTDIQKYLE